MRRRTVVTLALMFSTLFCCAQTKESATTLAPDTSTRSKKPNILFIIMDDVGIDQLRIFAYGGLRPHGAPPTPNIDAIARAGIRFRNTWSMPECSPSRVMFFEGRYPLRTNIFNAILSTDVANSQLSPYETTTPNLLKSVGYTSALFGKFHLGGPDLNPFGSATPHMAGFDYFDGFLEGAPHPIDPTIGGQFSSDDPSTTCGFVPAASRGGADFGACRFADGSCSEITKDQQHPAPGRSCLEQGGLFVPRQGCKETPPFLNFFSQTNAYYVWNRVINQPDGTVQQFPLTEPTSRHYVSDSTTQSASDWIKRQRSKHRRWMATVSYANIHSPYQQPPTYLLPKDEEDSSGLKCTGNSKANTAALRIISNEMLEAMDNEIGRLLVGSGLATYQSDGSLNYDPQRTNTMVVIIGDNGTYAPSVKLPFDPNLSKGTAYQTGVWVPLIVAGPLVVSPDRSVSAMVNIADLFQLWGELTGIDYTKPFPIPSTRSRCCPT